MGALRYVGILLWFAGIAASIALVAWSGLDDVGDALAAAGAAGLAGAVLVRVVTVSVAGAGWWLLFPAAPPLRLGTAVLLRFVREGVNALLPFTQVAGDVIGARLLTFFAVPGPLAAASVIVDMLMQAATQFVFTALGLMALIVCGTGSSVPVTAATSLAVAAPLLLGFYVVQRRFGHRILHGVLSRIGGDGSWRVLGTVDAVYQGLAAIYARRRGLAASGAVHLAGWLAGVAEVLIVLRCMGLPATLGEALVIESLVQAVRGAAFAVPSALGAQEGALILLCGLFQIPADQALALSFIKRAADVAVGVPSLVVLQILEGRRFTAGWLRRGGPSAAVPRVMPQVASQVVPHVSLERD